MVQREVADRFFASPGTKAYGAVSVLLQLAAERTGFHPVSREVFRPRPNVDSALVAFRRLPLPDDFGRVKRVVEGGVRAPPEDVAELPRALRVSQRASTRPARSRRSDARPATRAEALAPPEFVALADALR